MGSNPSHRSNTISPSAQHTRQLSRHMSLASAASARSSGQSGAKLLQVLFRGSMSKGLNAGDPVAPTFRIPFLDQHALAFICNYLLISIISNSISKSSWLAGLYCMLVAVIAEVDNILDQTISHYWPYHPYWVWASHTLNFDILRKFKIAHVRKSKNIRDTPAPGTSDVRSQLFLLTGHLTISPVAMT